MKSDGKLAKDVILRYNFRTSSLNNSTRFQGLYKLPVYRLVKYVVNHFLKKRNNHARYQLVFVKSIDCYDISYGFQAHRICFFSDELPQSDFVLTVNRNKQ